MSGDEVLVLVVSLIVACVLWGKWRPVKGEELYDGEADRGQKANVADQHPGVVKAMVRPSAERVRARSGTADAVDDWIYSEVANTFVFDESMLERLKELNPHSAHSLVRRLLEANGRGYWETDQSVLEKLQEIMRDLEDQLEGVAQ